MSSSGRVDGQCKWVLESECNLEILGWGGNLVVDWDLRISYRLTANHEMSGCVCKVGVDMRMFGNLGDHRLSPIHFLLKVNWIRRSGSLRAVQ